MKPMRCRSFDWLTDLPCQGRSGHAGTHWAYSPGGWLCRWANKKESSLIAAEQIPPGHKTWVSPEVQTCGTDIVCPLLDARDRDRGRAGVERQQKKKKPRASGKARGR